MTLELRDAGVRHGERWTLRRSSVALAPGRCVALVGESGCGKSTLARALTGLEPLSEGARLLDGQPVSLQTRAQRLAFARQVQFVFQDAITALDPVRTVAESVAEPLAVRGEAPESVAAQVRATLARVGLSDAHAARKPATLSAGQRQRVGLARALIGAPRFLVLDEPVSALDAAVQAQIVGLLADLRRELGFGLLVVTHELGVAQALAQDVWVLFAGRLAEVGPADEVLQRPRHPASQALIAAARAPDLRTAPPPPPPWDADGCRYADRCAAAQTRCRHAAPPLEDGVACYFPAQRGAP